jgi:hypothetical protein
MYAILRLNTYDSEKMAAAADRMTEFDRLHAAQPGFEGSVGVDLGEGRRFALNLWDSVESSRAGQRVLVPHLERLLVPLMSAPSKFIGAGPVITWQIGSLEGGSRSTAPTS